MSDIAQTAEEFVDQAIRYLRGQSEEMDFCLDPRESERAARMMEHGLKYWTDWFWEE